MTKRALSGTHASHSLSRQSDPGGPPMSAAEDFTEMWTGMPWVKMWLHAWTNWFELFGVSSTARLSSEQNADERRQAAVPWLPQFDSTVIPLRRRDDPQGAEAAKVSMRLRVPTLPWSAGTSNIIAIDTLIPQPLKSAAEIPKTAH